MSSRPLAACLPQRAYKEAGLFAQETATIEYLSEDIEYKAVSVEDSSAVIDPKNMNIGQYYLAVVNQTPYLYRKINDDEIEVYGLARKD